MSLFGRPPRDGNCCRQLRNPLGVVHSHTRQQQQLRKRANNTFLVLAKRCALSSISTLNQVPTEYFSAEYRSSYARRGLQRPKIEHLDWAFETYWFLTAVGALANLKGRKKHRANRSGDVWRAERPF